LPGHVKIVASDMLVRRSLETAKVPCHPQVSTDPMVKDWMVILWYHEGEIRNSDGAYGVASV
jgi:hypothetical protein